MWDGTLSRCAATPQARAFALAVALQIRLHAVPRIALLKMVLLYETGMSENEGTSDPASATDAMAASVAQFRRQPEAVRFVALRQELRDAGRS